MTDEERDQRLQRLKKIQARIAILLLHQAQMGPRFPTDQALELQDAQADEARLSAELGLDVAIPVHPGSNTVFERLLLLEFGAKSLERVVNDALTAINAQLAQIRDDAHDWRTSERRTRIERQKFVDTELQRIQKDVERMSIRQGRLEVSIVAFFAALSIVSGVLIARW